MVCCKKRIVLPKRRLAQRWLGGLVHEAHDRRNMLATEFIFQNQTARADAVIIEGFAQCVDRGETDVHAGEPSAPMRKGLVAENAG